MKINEKKYLNTIKEHQHLIYKIASLYTNNKEDREDLVQEISYQLWKSFASFENQSSISTWLYRVSMNTAIQFLKKETRNRKYLNEMNSSDLSIDHDTDREASIQKLRESIEQLNALDKGIILLYLEEKSHQEIAEIIGLTISNVGTRIQRIKQKLSQLNKK